MGSRVLATTNARLAHATEPLASAATTLAVMPTLTPDLATEGDVFSQRESTEETHMVQWAPGVASDSDLRFLYGNGPFRAVGVDGRFVNLLIEGHPLGFDSRVLLRRDVDNEPNGHPCLFCRSTTTCAPDCRRFDPSNDWPMCPRCSRGPRAVFCGLDGSIACAACRGEPDPEPKTEVAS